MGKSCKSGCYAENDTTWLLIVSAFPTHATFYGLLVLHPVCTVWRRSLQDSAPLDVREHPLLKTYRDDPEIGAAVAKMSFQARAEKGLKPYRLDMFRNCKINACDRYWEDWLHFPSFQIGCQKGGPAGTEKSQLQDAKRFWTHTFRSKSRLYYWCSTQSHLVKLCQPHHRSFTAFPLRACSQCVASHYWIFSEQVCKSTRGYTEKKYDAFNSKGTCMGYYSEQSIFNECSSCRTLLEFVCQAHLQKHAQSNGPISSYHKMLCTILGSQARLTLLKSITSRERNVTLYKSLITSLHLQIAHLL